MHLEGNTPLDPCSEVSLQWDEMGQGNLRRKTAEVSPQANGSIRRPVKRQFEWSDDSEALIVDL